MSTHLTFEHHESNIAGRDCREMCGKLRNTTACFLSNLNAFWILFKYVKFTVCGLKIRRLGDRASAWIYVDPAWNRSKNLLFSVEKTNFAKFLIQFALNEQKTKFRCFIACLVVKNIQEIFNVMLQVVQTIANSLRFCGTYELADSQRQLASECSPPFD